MLVTHAQQLIDPNSPQMPLCAKPIGNIPNHYVTSATTNIERRYWAWVPRDENIHDFERWVDEAFVANETNEQRRFIPTEFYRNTRQSIIPINSKPVAGEQPFSYYSISSLESLGLLSEIFERTKEYREHGYYHTRLLTLCKNPRDNFRHTELMVEQHGSVSVLAKSIDKFIENDPQALFTGIGVRLVIENASILSGFVGVGHPNITSLGTYVANIEKSIGQSIRFSIGLTDVKYNGDFLPKDGLTGKVNKRLYSLKDTEFGATITLVLLLQGSDNRALYEYLQTQEVKHLCGGEVISREIGVFNNTPAPQAAYLYDASESLNQIEGQDALAKIMEAQNDAKLFISINHVGYAALEQPVANRSPRIRNNLEHCWTEPVYGAVGQQVFDNNKTWWYRSDFKDGLMTWCNYPSAG
ncbi:hypothetical protein E6P75_08850 [Moraxella osloensis]|uniref:Uncharacterized protein n=2 Tax=Gammaproteobacteria TaxID=1236 RepID=A0AAW6TIW4_FAUOS|nr:hypothetical protein [Moraxella osloensis]MDI4510312.1 hypothetical protein [Moraxella osloensis]BDD45359.1 hypothetical protein 4 [Moraxellaceae bacterium]